MNGGLAQLGERLPCTQQARGSSPLTSTMAIRFIEIELEGKLLARYDPKADELMFEPISASRIEVAKVLIELTRWRERTGPARHS